jgi:hypothetical protein
MFKLKKTPHELQDQWLEINNHHGQRAINLLQNNLGFNQTGK